MSNAIREALRKLAPPQADTLLHCTVVAVDRQQMTCDVSPLGGGMVMYDVRLKAVVGSHSGGVTLVPSIGAYALVGMVDEQHAMLLSADRTDEVLLGDGTNGGMVNVQALLDDLGKVKDILNAVLSLANGTPITEPGNGAPSALQVALKAKLAGLDLPALTGLEDEKVKH